MLITLHDARILSGFTLMDAAIACDITPIKFLEYEKDTRKIPFNLAKGIKRLFHVNLEQIFIGAESEYTKVYLKNVSKSKVNLSLIKRRY